VVIRSCRLCKQPFSTKDARTVYCSPECLREGRRFYKRALMNREPVFCACGRWDPASPWHCPRCMRWKPSAEPQCERCAAAVAA